MDIRAFPPAQAALAGRLPSRVGADLAPLQRATHGLLGVVDEAARLREQTIATGKYTQGGVVEIMKRHLAGEPARLLAEHSASVEKAKATLAERRAGLGKPKIDRSDIFGEMQRAELRATIRAMPAPDRVQLACGGDPVITEAVLSAAPVLSGLTAEVIAKVQTIAVSPHHAAELAELEDLDESIKVTEGVITMARGAIGALVPGDPKPFEAAA